MSAQAIVNIVDDEEMSSQGSVNAPMAPPHAATQQSLSAQAQAPIEAVNVHPGRQPKTTRPSSVTRTSRAATPTVPVQSTEVVATPTIVVDAPSRAETKQAFEEVSLAFCAVSSQHEVVQSGMQELATGVEELRCARAGDVETTAQVQATLQRTLSASSSLEMRLGQTEAQQAHARAAAEEAKRASEQALSQAAILRAEQEKTTTQISQVLTSRADETQRQIEGTTQVAMETQQKVQEMAQKIAEQKELTFLQANLAREAQAKLEEDLTRKTKKELQNVSAIAQQAQTLAQQSAQTSGTYETQLTEMMKKVTFMEQLIVQQRKKSMTLESQLSAAQDRIGGAERRAKMLEEENTRIQSEITYWNDLYSQETGETTPSATSNAPLNVATSSSTPVPSPVSPVMPVQIPPVSIVNPSTLSGGASGSTLPIPFTEPVHTPTLSPPMTEAATSDIFGSMPPFSEPLGPWDDPDATRRYHARRESFGSVFPGSSGTGGNGGGNGNGGGGVSVRPPQMPHGSGTTFQIGIKPKDPLVFYGRANEDVDTWIAKVGDFLYLTEANSRQQVAYAATLLQEAAADWWVTLLRERAGRRPDDWAEFTVLLAKRFGSTTRVDRARAELRNIRQGQSETVRSYSTRFESLLGKLPSFDREWAKTQFVWGLHQRVAELVTIASPGDLHAAINHAEKVEMARNFAASGQQGQRQGNPNRGRGGWSRGRGKFNAVQATNSGNAGNQREMHQVAVQNTVNSGQRSLGNNQCRRCRGWGHWSKDCPSPYNAGNRGGSGRTMRGRRGGRGRGR